MALDRPALTSIRLELLPLVAAAGQILARYFRSGDYATTQKAGADFTTQADEEVDAFLRRALGERFPFSSFLTEETAPADHSACADLPSLWVIDPLDGTTNFSRGNPHFAISVALVDHGRPQLGVVHLPISGETFWAQRDRPGALRDGRPIRVSGTSSLREAVVACDWAWDLERRKHVVRWLDRIAPRVRQIRSAGCAAADLAQLAEGKIDAYLHSGVKPWDVAGAALLVEQAGGRITTPSGGPWDVFCPDILATNGVLHDPLLAFDL